MSISQNDLVYTLGLDDYVDMIVDYLKSGYSFDDAIDLVVHENFL
jgi:Flp pilus assembly protein TadB